MKLVVSWILVTLVAPLSAQASGGGRGKPDVPGLIAAAEKLHAGGHDEAATALLEQAMRQLGDNPSAALRKRLGKAIEALMGKCDSRLPQRRQAMTSAGRSLVSLASAYERRKWFKLAARVVSTAQKLDPKVVKTLAARLKSHMPKPPSKKPPANTHENPKDFLPEFGATHAHDWTVTPSEIRSPKLEKPESELLFSKHSHRDHVVSIEVKRPDKPGVVALVFGEDGVGYYIFEVQYFRGPTAMVILYQWDSHQLRTVGTHEFPLSPVIRKDWLRYAVRVDGKRVYLSVGDEERMRLELSGKPYGRVGLFISGNSEYKDPVRFRKLHIYESAESAKTKLKAKVDSTSILTKVAQVEPLMAGGHNELATIRLLNLQREAEVLESATVRQAVRATIEQLLVKADRMRRRYLGSHANAARPIVRIAAVYAEIGWFATARELLVRAGRLDAATAEKPLAAMDVALAKREAEERARQEKLRGLSPEPQEATDNAATNAWFEKGAQPWDSNAWLIDRRGFHSPLGKKGTSMVVSSKQASEALKFSLHVRAGKEQAGIAFGLKSLQAYWLLSWQYEKRDGLTYVQLYRWDGSKFARVGAVQIIKFSPEALQQWMTVTMELVPGKVSAKLGKAPSFSVPVPAQEFAGSLGLFAHTKGTGSVGFRNLKLLPK